jgi:hypothetical protein
MYSIKVVLIVKQSCIVQCCQDMLPVVAAVALFVVAIPVVRACSPSTSGRGGSSAQS